MKNVCLFCLLMLMSITVSSKEYSVVDILGDSISHGVNPQVGDNSGWVQMMYGTYDAQSTIYQIWPSITAYNSAVSGSKSSDWVSPSYSPMSTLLSHRPDLVVVFIGGNDILAYAADSEFSLSEKSTYRQNLGMIIDRLRSNTPQPDILLVNYYDLFDGYSSNLPSNVGQYRVLSQAAIDGNQIINDVASEKGCALVDRVYSSFMHHCYGGSLGDTSHLSPDYVRTPLANFDIHPNTEGHKAICRIIFEYLRQMKLEGNTGIQNHISTFFDCLLP